MLLDNPSVTLACDDWHRKTAHKWGAWLSHQMVEVLCNQVAVEIIKENKMSYSNRLKANVTYDRNVLEITLEKKDKEAEINVDEGDIARVMKSLGIYISSQLEGY